MNDSKSFLGSKTVQGIIVAGLAMLARYFDFEIADAEINELVLQVIGLGGLLYGLFGRLKAEKRIDRLI